MLSGEPKPRASLWCQPSAGSPPAGPRAGPCPLSPGRAASGRPAALTLDEPISRALARSPKLKEARRCSRPAGPEGRGGVELAHPAGHDLPGLRRSKTCPIHTRGYGSMTGAIANSPGVNDRPSRTSFLGVATLYQGSRRVFLAALGTRNPDAPTSYSDDRLGFQLTSVLSENPLYQRDTFFARQVGQPN